MSAYLFVFDRNSITDYIGLHDRIKSDYHISTWWHYLDSAYIFISNNDTNTLQSSIRAYFPGKFLLIKITRNNYNGWLPQDAWDWILNNVPTY